MIANVNAVDGSRLEATANNAVVCIMDCRDQPNERYGDSMQISQISRLIAMASVTAKRSIAGEVQKRVRECKCLVCEARAERRGVCMRHYQWFLRQFKAKGSEEARLSYEETLIREGKILAQNQMRDLKRDDPFAIAAQ